MITIVGANARRYTYVVVGTRVTAPDWNEILAWTPSNDRGLTLVACHPPGSVQYRFVVHAELI
jgi:sortase (surface protein transpeptidase)